MPPAAGVCRASAARRRHVARRLGGATLARPPTGGQRWGRAPRTLEQLVCRPRRARRASARGDARTWREPLLSRRLAPPPRRRGCRRRRLGGFQQMELVALTGLRSQRWLTIEREIVRID